jgi:peptide deformylase
MHILKTMEFGNIILRADTRQLTPKEISSAKVQTLIKNMQHTLKAKKLGVGLAAPQVGEPMALAVVCLQKTPLRPNIEEFDVVIINPKITKTFGSKSLEWEGCISGGPAKATLFAQVPRYKKVQLKYYDEKGKILVKVFDGLAAHVIQHETDHLNGVLFVDRVKDSKTYITLAEYKKMLKSQKAKP